MITVVSVAPPLTTLKLAAGQTGTQVYKVLSPINGQTVDVTSQCSLALDNAQMGTFAGATLTAKAVGGQTLVRATCGAAEGTAELDIVLLGTTVDPTAPPNAGDLFGKATLDPDPSKAPAIEYPLDQAVAPRNLPSPTTQWTAGGGDLYHVSITGPFVAMDLYTKKREGAVPEALWTTLTDASAGTSLTFVVETLVTATPQKKWAGPAANVKLSKDSVDNTAIYWWASSQGQIMTQTFGQTDAPTTVKNDCTSCHSLSRSGTRFGYSRCIANDCGQLFQGFMKFDKTSGTWVDTVDANNKTIHGSYSTFSPVGNPYADDGKSAALVSLADDRLELYDPDTGAVLPSNVSTKSTMGSQRTATMPDWSPDGKSVVFASTPHQGQWIDVSDSHIASMSYTFSNGSHVFGDPTMIVAGPVTLPQGTFDNFFFPSFSPDGDLIVFNGARAAWRNFQDARSPGQRLMLTNPKGDWVTDLTAMNGPGDLDITWPHWAPSTSQDYLWVVFTSERDYGHLLTAANSAASCVANGVKQCKQIWIGAIDRKKLAAPGQKPAFDPSAPPMWLPGQDIGADNISPYWTLPAKKQLGPTTFRWRSEAVLGDLRGP